MMKVTTMMLDLRNQMDKSFVYYSQTKVVMWSWIICLLEKVGAPLMQPSTPKKTLQVAQTTIIYHCNNSAQTSTNPIFYSKTLELSNRLVYIGGRIEEPCIRKSLPPTL
jgi:hypothetical protein